MAPDEVGKRSMQSILHELPYNPRGWTHGDFGHGDVGRKLLNRVIPWSLLADVIDQNFCVSTTAHHSASVVVAAPGSRPVYNSHVTENYLKSKRIQQGHLSIASERRIVLVDLAPKENDCLLAIFFAAVHLALDGRGDQEPSTVPHLVFACQASYLNRLHAAAHCMDVYNTRITEATFV